MRRNTNTYKQMISVQSALRVRLIHGFVDIALVQYIS